MPQIYDLTESEAKKIGVGLCYLLPDKFGVEYRFESCESFSGFEIVITDRETGEAWASGFKDTLFTIVCQIGEREGRIY